jgi:alpha/beta superfamily hydrolase
MFPPEEGIPGCAAHRSIVPEKSQRETHVPVEEIFRPGGAAICSPAARCGYMRALMNAPAHRTLLAPGPAGRLETLLWSLPEETKGAPPLAAVVCHPHPLFGGTMHNKVVYQTAKTIHGFGLPVVRFNFRGVGLSEGTHDKGVGEDDVRAMLDFLAEEYPGVPQLVAGFSFGSWVGLRAGCGDARVTDLVGLGLPVGDIDHRSFAYLETCAKPKLLVSGEFDRFGPPHQLRAMVAQFPPPIRDHTSVAIVSGGDHFFAGHLPELDRAITNWLRERHPELAEREAQE